MNFLELLWENTVLICAASGWLIAQVAKTILYTCIMKKFTAERLVGAGGMPSSHSATVCALTTSCAILYGFSSFEFAISAIVAFIAMYDAMGVRRQAGNQAQVLNKMIESFQNMSNDSLSDEEKLKELVGHTPLQVLVGAVLGILISIAVCALRGCL
ncbi:MAG: divergent PAP2 family protein [Lachnospiraceae bacterium]|nr:divergent PAP2 family protein [Lachnospiraceae bacterium]